MVRRVVILLALLASLAAMLIGLRAAQTRASAMGLRLERDWLATQREVWQLQASVARLRAPENVHERIARFDTDLLPPETIRLEADED